MFSVLIILTLGFSAAGWAEEQTAPQPKAYFFEEKGIKELYIGQIYGSDCNNLKGSIDVGKRSTRGLWETFKWARANGNLDLPVDDEIRQEYRKKIPTEFTWVCVPYVKNIKSYLEKGEIPYKDGVITFTNGPVLLYRRTDEAEKKLQQEILLSEKNKRPVPKGMLRWEKDKYWKVKRLSNCSTHDNEFCAKLEFHTFQAEGNAPPERSEGNFRVFCWDCHALRSSPEALQKAYIFRQWLGLYGVVFDGAYMVDENSFFTPPYISPYLTEEGRAELVAQWEQLRALAENQR